MLTMNLFVALLMRNISGEQTIMSIGMRMTIKTVTHNNKACIFNEASHTYTVNGKQLISGTTFIKQFLPKFDAQSVADKIADKRGTTPEALLKEWKEKGERANREGSMVHGYSEWMHDPNSDPGLPPYAIEANRVGLLTAQLLQACDKLQDKYFEPIEAEKIIFSLGLGVAGMIDLLMSSLARQVIILDWKTNSELTTSNPFQNCFPPIDHLEDANLNHYALQLSLYQYILRAENYFPDDTEFKRIIVHLTEDNHYLYSVKYLEDEIEAILI